MNENHRFENCESDADRAYALHRLEMEKANAANVAAYAADAADTANVDRDSIYTIAAECCIEVLRELNQPGVKLMDKLCPLKKSPRSKTK